MLAEQDVNVLAVDLDPQCNLTAAFLREDELETLMERAEDGSVSEPRQIGEGLHLLPGDLRLSRYEDALSDAWQRCRAGDRRALGVTSAFYQTMQASGRKAAADLILVDLDSHLGALNRSALIAADWIVLPIVPDLFSIHGLRNLGPTLASWRNEWQLRLDRCDSADVALPPGAMRPLGYILQQQAIRLDRPAKAFDRWTKRIPGEYGTNILRQTATDRPVTSDPECLAILKNYHSLVPLAREARKPMFFLKPADGAVGGHAAGVGDAYLDYKRLASRITERAGIAIPAFP
jgi:cellulose biosynthesis protein BcsQ